MMLILIIYKYQINILLKKLKKILEKGISDILMVIKIILLIM